MVTPSTTNQIVVNPFTYVPLKFNVNIQNTLYAQLDGLIGAALQNVRVYLNETILGMYGMNISQNGLLTDAAGSVTFSVGISGSTADGLYQIPAYAEFENDYSLNSTNNMGNTKTFSYFWLNGITSGIGKINATLSISNYSAGNSTDINVKRTNVMTVVINNVFDKNNVLVSSGQVLRGYKLNLTIHYTDAYGVPKQGYSVKLTTIVADPSGNNNRTINPFGTTDAQGYIQKDLIIGNNYSVGPATIIAEDPSVTTNVTIQNATFNILSHVLFNNNPAITLPNGYNELFVGENISISGTVYDDLGPINSSSYRSDIRNELINHLYISGYNTTNGLIAGTGSFTNISFSTNSAEFNISWQIPAFYKLNNFAIFLNLTTATHFIYGINSTFISNQIPVFQSVMYTFSLTNSNTTQST